MKTKWSVALFILTLLFIFSGCGPSAKKDEQTYSNRDQGFSINYPKTWKIQTNIKGPVFYVSDEDSPDLKKPSMNIIIDKNVKSTLDEYIETYFIKTIKDMAANKDINAAIKDLGPVSKEKYSLQKKDAYKVSYEFTYTIYKIRLKVVAVIFAKDKDIFVITAVGSANSFNTLNEVFSKSLNSLRFY